MFWFPRTARGDASGRGRPPLRRIVSGSSAKAPRRESTSSRRAGCRACKGAACTPTVLPAEVFRPHEVGGYWVAGEPVEAIEQVIIDDLAGRHAAARIELRITPSIWPFWRRAANSTVEFSGSRLGNSAPHPDRFG
jgi:hypothetical protein